MVRTVEKRGVEPWFKVRIGWERAEEMEAEVVELIRYLCRRRCLLEE